MGKRTRNIYFSADWHLGHANVMKYSNRPFKDTESMSKALIKRFNSTVRTQDVTYFLGDIGFSGASVKDVMNQLNGTKILILGNHDGKQQKMMNLGFDAVLNSGSMRISNELVTFTHCPLRGVYREDTSGMKGSDGTENWHKEDKHVKFSIEDQGQFHLSGHTHAPNGGKSSVKLHRQWDVGVDGNGYKPVSISEIESWIHFTKKTEAYQVDIEGYEGYKINKYGEVFSFKRYPDGYKLSTHLDKDGYVIIAMMRNGENKKEKLHRLLGKAFIENPENLPQINHKNGSKRDNRLENLEWSSNIDNQRHAWDSDLKTIKLKVSDVDEIKKKLQEGKNNTEIAKEYNVDPSTISNIKTGRTWERNE